MPNNSVYTRFLYVIKVSLMASDFFTLPFGCQMEPIGEIAPAFLAGTVAAAISQSKQRLLAQHLLFPHVVPCAYCSAQDWSLQYC